MPKYRILHTDFFTHFCAISIILKLYLSSFLFHYSSLTSGYGVFFYFFHTHVLNFDVKFIIRFITMIVLLGLLKH